MKKPLGCVSLSGFITAGLVLLIIIGFIAVGGGTIFSPGPLNAQAGEQPLGNARSHDDLSHRCEACHAPFWGREIMSDRCLVCHTEVTAELKNPASLHSALTEGPFRACQQCHTEHNGAAAMLTPIDPLRFPHQATGYELQAHQQLANGDPFTCTSCHPQNLGDFSQQTCAECHAASEAVFMQAHIGTFGGACLACHDGVDTYGAAFDHNQTKFRLDGAHAQIDCAGCHQGQFVLVSIKATPQECYGCHQKDDPHNGQYGEQCATCHIAASWAETVVDHAKTGFPLTGAHGQVECQACHINNVFKNTPQQCFACHQKDDPHQGQFGQDCAGCHSVTAWTPAGFNGPHPFPMDHGADSASPCQACHPTNLQTYTCYGCHEHTAANIEGKHREEGIRDFQDCMRCHPTGREEEGEEGDN